MAAKYQAYPEYQDTGVEWLGDIPEHWDVKKLKFFASVQPSNVDKKSKEGEHPVNLCNYTDVYYNDNVDESLEYMAATATDEQIEKFTLKAGDTIITKDSEDPTDIAIPTYVPNDLPGVVCGYHLAMIRPFDSTYGSFIKRVFESGYARAYFCTRSNGLTRYGLGAYPLSNVFYPRPPKEEVLQIANFLDHETAKIDTLIDKQQQLIKLLKEKRQAVISHAVTKGLNPAAPMKDSGVEWLGEVPEGWVVRRVKHAAKLQSGIPKGKDLTGKNTIEVPMLRVANVQDGYLSLDDIHNIRIEPHELDRYELQNGDVLMNEGGDNDKLGRGAVWRGEIRPCIHQNHVFAIRPVSIEPEWLDILTRASYAKFYFYSVAKQSTNLASISSTNIKDTPLLIPPKVERTEIISYLTAQFTRFDLLETKANLQVKLLQERRTALNSAAVTGKIDVRNWQSAG